MQSTKKDLHIDVCLKGKVDGNLSTGLEGYGLVHNALPEIALSEVDTSTAIFGKRLNAPLLIAPMTGGCERGRVINRNLAKAAQGLGIGMVVGSQKAALKEPSLTDTFMVRDVAPDVLLFANLGAVDLNNGFGVEECMKAVEMIGADVLMLHLNPLQEALQDNGDCDFSGLASSIKDVVRQMDVPVVLREVSFGISEETAEKIAGIGAAGVDVGGAGGTSWALVEGEVNGGRLRGLAQGFSSWGVSTASSIMNVRKVSKDIPLIATGGIRTGVDVAKAIALGADAAGIARPLLPLAMESADSVNDHLREVIDGLRIAMFCAGCRDLTDSKKTGIAKI